MSSTFGRLVFAELAQLYDGCFIQVMVHVGEPTVSFTTPKTSEHGEHLVLLQRNPDGTFSGDSRIGQARRTGLTHAIVDAAGIALTPEDREHVLVQALLHCAQRGQPNGEVEHELKSRYDGMRI